MKISMKKTVATVLFLSVVLSLFADNFTPQTFPQTETTVALDVNRHNHMAVVRGEVNGVEAFLLFDTGASHTTLNEDFVRRNFPSNSIQQVIMAAETNVQAQPSLVHLEELKLGDAAFTSFDAMVLPLGHLSPSVGERIDGVVGMNIIATTRTLISFGGGKVVFQFPAEKRYRYRPIPRIMRFDPLQITFAAKSAATATPEAAFPMIIDSASSWTFIGNTANWRKAGEAMLHGATDVNGRGSPMAFAPGVPGELDCGNGISLPVTPLIFHEPLGRIGGDMLLRYDLLVDRAQIAFEPYQSEGDNNDETKAE